MAAPTRTTRVVPRVAPKAAPPTTRAGTQAPVAVQKPKSLSPAGRLPRNPEEKPEKQTQEIGRVAFNQIIDNISLFQDNVLRLNQVMAEVSRNDVVVIPILDKDGNRVDSVELDWKGLTALKDYLRRTIKGVKKLSPGKPKKTARHQPGDLRGVYAPQFVGPAIQQLAAAVAAQLGISLPGLAQGYTLRNSLNILFHLYSDTFGLRLTKAENPKGGQMISVDDAFSGFFTNTPALTVSAVDQDGARIKVENTQGLSTIEAIRAAGGKENFLQAWDTGVMSGHDFQVLTSFNFISANSLKQMHCADQDFTDSDQIRANLRNPSATLKADMIADYNTIKDASNRFKASKAANQ